MYVVLLKDMCPLLSIKTSWYLRRRMRGPALCIDEALTEEALSNVQTLTNTSFLNHSSIFILPQKMKTACVNQNSSFNFDDLNEPDYPFLTDLNKAQFDDFSNNLIQQIKTCPKRST